MSTQDQNQEVQFDTEKVNALPVWKAEDQLTSMGLVAAFAKEFTASDVSDAERLAALESIAKTEQAFVDQDTLVGKLELEVYCQDRADQMIAREDALAQLVSAKKSRAWLNMQGHVLQVVIALADLGYGVIELPKKESGSDS